MNFREKGVCSCAYLPPIFPSVLRDRGGAVATITGPHGTSGPHSLKSGKAMARFGLRMMPTSPSPPLKFRTAGFPQYGFKASLSGRAFPDGSGLKPTPGIHASPFGLHRPFARFRNGHADPARCPDPTVFPRAAVREARPPYPRGPWLRSEFCCLGPSSLLRPHPPVSQARGDFTTYRLYAAPSLCGSASATHETFPTFPAVLSMRAVDLTPVGPRPLPVVPGPRCQASSSYHRVATHESPSLPAIPDGVVDFGAASFASCCGPHVCPALLTGYDAMQPYVVHRAF